MVVEGGKVGSAPVHIPVVEESKNDTYVYYTRGKGPLSREEEEHFSPVKKM